MEDTDLMQFGKYQGKMMIDVPPKYLKWLFDEQIVSVNKWFKVWSYIKENYEAIELEIKKQDNKL